MESYATAAQVYAAGLVFSRISAMVMLLPGLGDAAVSPRIRLSLALLLALVITPIVASNITSVPATTGALAGRLIHEILVGLMIGALLRVFMSSLTVAGEIISIQSTLGFAQTVNPALGGNGSAIASFLSLTGVLIIMTTDLHHLFLGAMVRSYTLFPFDAAVPVKDASDMMIRTVSQAFSLGLQLSAPVLVFSIIVNVAAGLIARATPQIQIFLVVAPISVVVGLSLVALSLGLVGVVWADRYRDLLMVFN
jgi:flagellar biosynthesis protein FliR